MSAHLPRAGDVPQREGLAHEQEEVYRQTRRREWHARALRRLLRQGCCREVARGEDGGRVCHRVLPREFCRALESSVCSPRRSAPTMRTIALVVTYILSCDNVIRGAAD